MSVPSQVTEGRRKTLRCVAQTGRATCETTDARALRTPPSERTILRFRLRGVTVLTLTTSKMDTFASPSALLASRETDDLFLRKHPLTGSTPRCFLTNGARGLRNGSTHRAQMTNTLCEHQLDLRYTRPRGGAPYRPLKILPATRLALQRAPRLRVREIGRPWFKFVVVSELTLILKPRSFIQVR